MAKLNSELRAEARSVLKGNWLMSALVVLVSTLITNGVAMLSLGETIVFQLIYIAALLFVCPIIYFGTYIVFFDVYRNGRKIEVSALFAGFQDYGRTLGTMLLMFLYAFLWTLLLIIPGIVKSLSYAMTPFILRDNKDMEYNAAIEESMRLMEGNKWKLFKLLFSFIGWILLSILTMCIGMLFVSPYMYAAMAAFYEDLKAQDAQKLEI